MPDGPYRHAEVRLHLQVEVFASTPQLYSITGGILTGCLVDGTVPVSYLCPLPQ